MIQITAQYIGQDMSRTRGEIIRGIRTEIIGRGARVSNELTNQAALVMQGNGGGRTYRVPGTKATYSASAPGQPPAVCTGTYRASFQSKTTADGVGGSDLTVHSITESRYMVNGYRLYELLEDGTSRMAPRPHAEKIVEGARPAAVRIYSQPYGR